jgi:glucose dehydrogenase
MKTIAQQIKWDFETNGKLTIKDKNGNRIYAEDSGGVWVKYEYDSKGNVIYIETSNGDWAKYERDSQGNELYYENSNGGIIDNRPKTCEGKIVEFGGEKFKLVKV